MIPSNRAPVILSVVAIVAAGSIMSFFILISSKISHNRHGHGHYGHHLRTSDAASNRRQLLSQLNGFNDPKTVELRPAVNDHVRSDNVDIMEQIGAPNMMNGPNHEDLVFTPDVDIPMDMDGPVELKQVKSEQFFAQAVDEIMINNNNLNLDAQQAAQAEIEAMNKQQKELEAMNNVVQRQQGEVEAPPMVDPSINNGEAIANNNPRNIESEAMKGSGYLERSIPPYNIDNALRTTQAFRYTLFFFVYDSATDTFVIVNNIPHCDHGCLRIFRLASTVASALRKNFPGRFQGGQSESEEGVTKSGDFVVMMSCGDVPRIYANCLDPGNDYCDSADFAPILNFGSVFVDANILPSAIAMPLPVRPHMPCFDEWQATNFGEDHGVCQDLQPNVDFSETSIKSGLVFGQELGMMESEDYWDQLIPQIIWRGTDFGFLHTMFHEMRSPEYQLDIAPKEAGLYSIKKNVDKKRWVIQTLWEMGDEKLLPRWRGVLLTSEAELDATKESRRERGGEPVLPWCNIKFASINKDGIKVSADDNPDYQVFQKLGISVIGEHVNMVEQAKYRYHIDLGGGGGTTWTGTIQKLALPGLLFHHMTPTKDYFHDLLVPWEHYVPINTDLSDLREKYEWAESHPLEAKQISENGTRFARRMGSMEGFGQLYEHHIVAPLRNTLRAYNPLPPRYAGKSVLDIVTESSDKFTVVGRCSGLHTNSCEELVET